MGLEDALESPAFWLLAGGGLIAEILGYIMSKRMELEMLPLWQLGLIMIVTVLAAAFFATKD